MAVFCVRVQLVISERGRTGTKLGPGMPKSRRGPLKQMGWVMRWLFKSSLLYWAAALSAGYFFFTLRFTSPGPACPAQYLRRPPGGPREGSIAHPAASHRLFLTFTMPCSLCPAQRRAPEPGNPNLGFLSHTLGAGESHLRLLTSRQCGGAWAAHLVARSPTAGPNEGCFLHPGASHRLLTTSTIPRCACVAQRDALKPGFAKLGTVGHPSILQR